MKRKLSAGRILSIAAAAIFAVIFTTACETTDHHRKHHRKHHRSEDEYRAKERLRNDKIKDYRPEKRKLERAPKAPEKSDFKWKKNSEEKRKRLTDTSRPVLIKGQSESVFKWRDAPRSQQLHEKNKNKYNFDK